MILEWIRIFIHSKSQFLKICIILKVGFTNWTVRKFNNMKILPIFSKTFSALTEININLHVIHHGLFLNEFLNFERDKCWMTIRVLT